MTDASVIPHHTTPTPTPTTPPPTSTEDVVGGGQDWIEQLAERGVARSNAINLVASFDAERIRQAVKFWDSQPNAGPGLLVQAVRDGRAPVRRRSLIDEQREYGQQIVDWLNQNFPELSRPTHGPHPAAVAEVIQLHYEHGKGALTKAKHGPAIRAAVRRFNDKWGV